jgi:Response regulator containing CheY-like receiver domain and AraC-type DNA-binding domain
VEKSVLDNEQKTSRKILYQIKTNIDLINDMVKNICLSTYNDTDIKRLMYLKGEETYEDMQRFDKLNTSVISTFNFLHSIYIYNNIKKTYYSTNVSFYYKDEELEKFIKSHGIIIRLKPYVREIDIANFNKNEKIVSYFMYDMLDMNNVMDGAVIVNVKLEWLLNNINMINAIDKKNQDNIYLLDDNGDLINPTDENAEYTPEIVQLYKKKMPPVKEDIGFFTSSVHDETYLLSYINLQPSGWTILKVQPYGTVYEYINRLKSAIIIITLIFLALTLIASYSVAKYLYKPIGKLINNVQSTKTEDVDYANTADEFIYLQEVYKDNINKLESYKKDKKSNQDILKDYFLRKLLFDSAFFKNNNDTGDIFRENNILLKLDMPIIVCVLKIDNYSSFESRFDNNDKSIFKKEIKNVLTGILSNNFISEVVDMGKDQIVFIINANESDTDFYNDINLLIKQGQQELNIHWSSVSVSVSEMIKDTDLLTGIYYKTLDNLMYRYIFGTMSFITPDIIKGNLKNSKAVYDFGYEDKFIDALKASNIKQCEAELREIKKEISKHEINIITVSMMHFVINIMNTIFEINRNRLEPIKININKLGRLIFELETIDDFFAEVEKMLDQIDNSNKLQKKARNYMIYETIEEIVDINYNDCNLCIDFIASKLKMSSAKTSAIFEEYKKISIPNYINAVRLGKAVEWLENSNLSIEEIMHKVGIENESYFYKLFKSRYGTTPRGFISKRFIKHEIEN